MARSFTRISLVLALLLSSEVWAVGLGDIRLESALNEPLRAEIELLSATPEELTNLSVALASADTFARYGIDRPYFLQNVEFSVVTAGARGPVVLVRSRAPVTEPFLTFLVEATWSSGRLLREYTLLLDPPTYSPPAVQQAPVVQAPRRAVPADSAPIQREPEPAPEPVYEAPAPTRAAPPRAEPTQPAPVRQPEPAPVVDDRPYAADPGGDYVVQRSETLWRIATNMRPDSRLTINQTMLAIFEANPQAFGGNINVMRAGARLRIPSADEVFRINRSDALTEVKRQHAAWGGPSAAAVSTTTRPSLTLVPPDEEPATGVYDDTAAEEPMSREEQIEARIAELEAADVPDQQSLIEIRDDELANLRQELANIRGEIYEPPVDETPVEDVVADDEAPLDEALDAIEAEAEDAGETTEPVAEEPEEAQPVAPTNVVRTDRRQKETGIVDTILGALSSIWTGIISALLVVAGLLLWFVRRGRSGDDDSGPWEELDDGDLPTGALTATETLRAPKMDDDAIVVVEQRGSRRPERKAEVPSFDEAPDSGQFGSMEDTFSSETAINLDQTDPLAEADFHMAYGLYDQAADLITGALESDPSDRALLSKLCEIYFVWGNRDAFIDAASQLKEASGGGDSEDWNKIVIMGQQIAGDDPLFAGAGVAGATREVDLSFDAGEEDGGALDMDFGSAEDDSNAESDVIDLGGGDDDGLDFFLDDAATGERESVDKTVEMPSQENTRTSRTIEEQLTATSELPAIDDAFSGVFGDEDQNSDATAEINLDELGLDVDDLDATGTNELLEITGSNVALDDDTDATGRNLEIDTDATGVREGPDFGDDFDFDDIDSTGMRLAPDETGRMPMLDVERETDTSIDVDLLEATGHTQVLPDDILSDDEATTLAALDAEDIEISGDAETLLASLDDDEDDFDFAKTEALPADVFTGGARLDETSEMRAVAETDMDLDLEDLTAALRRTDSGDTVEYPRDDKTVEQPRPSLDDTTEAPTLSISPDELSDDLQDARTMTEVGTKLDLARAYVDMGDPAGARSILEEVLDEGDASQRQQAQKLLDSLPS